MYNAKAPCKLVAKTRRGLTQNYEKIDILKESTKKSNGNVNSPEVNNIPRPVFNNAKRATPTKIVEDVQLTPQHAEIVRYVNDSWNMIVAQNPYDANGAAKAKPTDSNSSSSSSSSSSATTTAATVNASANVNGNGNGNVSVNGVVDAVNSNSDNNANKPAHLTLKTAPTYWIEPPSPALNDFTPFDLESWWGRRLFHNITKNA